MTITEAAEKSPILKKASSETKAKILSYGIIQKYNKNQLIFREREEVNYIYFIAEGYVVLHRYNYLGDRKNIFVCSVGEMLNEVILEEPVASISAEALNEVTLLVFPRHLFMELLEDSSFSKMIIDSSAKKIRRLYHQMVNTSNMFKLERQVAAKLWKLGRDFGIKTDEGIRVSFELSISFLADMVGAKRESVSRVMKKYRINNVISTSKNCFVILDMEKLLDMAHEKDK